MNRKLLFGCLGVFGLLVLVGGVVFYMNIVRPATRVAADFRQLSQLRTMNEKIANRGPFTAPDGGELTREQVDRFVAVQSAMRDSLGSGYDTLRARSAQLRPAEGTRGRFDLRKMIESFEGLGPILTLAKAAQVDALNTQGFSMAEYRWVRESVYGALGVKAMGVYLDDLPVPGRSPKESPVPPPPSAERADVPGNQELVAPYRADLETWRPFLAFGL